MIFTLNLIFQTNFHVNVFKYKSFYKINLIKHTLRANLGTQTIIYSHTNLNLFFQKKKLK